MSYLILSMPKKNAVRTTIASPGITDSDTTIPVAELSKFYDKNGSLITDGIVIGFLNNSDIIPEEITITGASGTSGAGNLTGATRGVNADGSIGAAHAWDTGTEIAVMFSTGIYLRIRDDLEARAPNPQNDYIKLDPLGCMVPVTDYAGVDQDETSTNKNNYVYGNYTQAGDGTNRLQWKEIIKEDWKSDGNFEIKFHWTVKTGTAGHKVKWEIFAKQLADGESLDTALVSLGTVEDAIIGAEYEHISAATVAAAISGTAGSLVMFEIRRITSSATETSSDARLLGASLKYIRTLT